MGNRLHIVSFDIPYPADYGGVIDVFYKIKALHEQGVKIVLHCFQYGHRKPSELLETYTEKVFYYPRNTSLIRLLSPLPYIVSSRCSKELLKNILSDPTPVLLEGWHSTCLLSQFKKVGLQVLVREHNLEWKYYEGLANNTRHFGKKIYYKWEANKLKKYEQQLYVADQLLCISPEDVQYHTQKGYKSAVHQPVFHPFTIQAKPGIGKFALYHGNLAVEENIAAVKWLLDNVWHDMDFSLIIFGNGAPNWLKSLIAKHKNVSLSTDAHKLPSYIEEAHCHVLPAMQDTGIKLKLLHALYAGRFCIVNSAMVKGTGLEDACIIANHTDSWKVAVQNIITTPFTESNIETRKRLLTTLYDNKENIRRLMTYSSLLP